MATLRLAIPRRGMWGSCRGVLEAVVEVQDRLLWLAMVEMWDVR